MKLGIYATKDKVIGSFAQPFYMQNDNQAKRNWAMSIGNAGPEVPVEDLELYKLGTLDDESGEIESKVEYLMRGNDVKKENTNVLHNNEQAKSNSTTKMQ